MKKNNVSQIIKRNGDIVPFDAEKIFKAIDKALTAVGKSEKGLARKLGEEVVGQITNKFHGSIPSVENVQDIVEEVLMRSGFPETARAYILYREKRTNVRELKNSIGVRDDLKLSVNAVKVLKQRYLIKDKSGKIIETPRRMFERVAKTIAAVERKRGWNQNTESLERQYFDMMGNLDFLQDSLDNLLLGFLNNGVKV